MGAFYCQEQQAILSSGAKASFGMRYPSFFLGIVFILSLSECVTTEKLVIIIVNE
jgi:hypothetical protein